MRCGRTNDLITLDQDTAEELVILLKEHYPDGNITPDTKSFHHFLRIHKLQRIIQESHNKLQKHITGK